jgi:hypothetical protein
MFDRTIMMEREVSICMCQFCRRGQRSGRNDEAAENMNITLANSHGCETPVLVRVQPFSQRMCVAT